MYFTSVCVLQSKKRSVKHVFYEGLCASEQWNAAWTMYFMSVCMLQSKETQRESRIYFGLLSSLIIDTSYGRVRYILIMLEASF
jgi:hypothetical protein